ncbi:MAG: succinate dehydrogenase, cytochrome b556 subunit [Gammaproteobacteria bacterium]
MATVERPLSPHLQIYKPQLTSMLSILHRATGILLSLGALLLSFWLLALASGPATYAEVFRHVHTWYGGLLLILFTFSLYYHLCNGIRHLFWDMGAGLELQSVYLSGYLVVLAAFVLTVITWMLGTGTTGGAA